MTDTALSFEQIRQMFQDIAEMQKVDREQMRKSREEWEIQSKKNREEWEIQSKKSREKFDQEMNKSREEWEEIRKRSGESEKRMEKTDRRLDRLSEQLGGLHNSMGELMETLIASHLWEKFSNYPYQLTRGYQRIRVFDKKSVPLTEIDILLADSEWVMAVEVKREPRKDDIDYHLKRMELIRQYPPAEVVGKKLLGAIAGGVVSPDVHSYAHQAGFFILELLGDNVALVPPPAGFSPHIW